MDRYRKENGTVCIDISVREYRQLYDSRDPSPFHERDLDENLVRYLVMSCEEIEAAEPVKLVINSAEMLRDNQQLEDFTLAIHQYFEHEVRALNNELRYLFRQGRFSLFFGLVFLMICVFGAVRVSGEANVWYRAIYEGLIIMGWVALWKPINIFLYDWWPYHRKIDVYRRLASIPVEFNSN